MLPFVALLATSLGLFGHAQITGQDAPPMPPVGDWREADAGGGFRFEYFFAWKPFEYVGRDEQILPMDICSFPCIQKKHTQHKECDFSCDDPCQTEHVKTIRPTWRSNLDNLLRYLEGTFRDLNNTKIPWSFESRGEGTVEAIYADFQEAVLKPVLEGDYQYTASVHFDGAHSPEGCGVVHFEYRLGRSALVMKYRLYDSTGKIAEGEYTPAGYLYVALPRTPKTEWVHQSGGGCLCQPHETKVSQIFDPVRDGKMQPPGVWIDEGNTGGYAYATQDLIQKHGIHMTCSNMNEFEIGADHPTVPISVLVYPGAILKPLDPAYQQILLCSRISAKFDPAEGLLASIFPAYAPPLAKGTAACLDIDKQMPTASTPYQLGIPADGRLMTLGRIAGEQTTYGPWDQARVWIYTAGATLDRVNKKMMLGVTATQYVGELYNLETKAGVDLATPKYRSCLTPDLLLGKSGPAAAIGWYAPKISLLDPAGVASMLTEKHAAFADLLSGLDTARQRLHVVALFNGLLHCGDDRVELAALKVLNEHTDQGELKLLMKSRGLLWVGRLLKSKNLEIASEALTLFEKLSHPYALSFLPKLSTALPELKSRISVLAATLEAKSKASLRPNSQIL
jgi:hypothetical protein